MTARLRPHPADALMHAAFVGAAIALFIFILCWAGEATGFYPPAGNWIELITSGAELRTHDAFWRGAGSAALFGAIVAALIAFCADGLARIAQRRR